MQLSSLVWRQGGAQETPARPEGEAWEDSYQEGAGDQTPAEGLKGDADEANNWLQGGSIERATELNCFFRSNTSQSVPPGERPLFQPFFLCCTVCFLRSFCCGASWYLLLSLSSPSPSVLASLLRSAARERSRSGGRASNTAHVMSSCCFGFRLFARFFQGW